MLIVVGLLIFLFLTLRKSQKKEPQGLGLDEGAAPEKPKVQEKRGGVFSRYTRALSLKTSFSRAIRFLRENVAGRDYLYQIPWYMVVGESGSGKTTLLESAGIRASLREGGEDFGIHQAIQWRFFNRGILLDVYGDYLLQPEDLSSDDIGWESLLNQLQNHRARRPIDGIAIALPCTDFLAPRADDVQALGAKAARLYDKLWRAQTVLGMCLPVYVIVTKCDLIPGFWGFCQELPARLRQDIFGWSSPYSLATAFNPAFVDEAFDSLGLDLHRLQCEIFAERGECRNADDTFIFPGEFQPMREALRFFLARLFKETAYRESFFFRGLYFCGDSGAREFELVPLAKDSSGALAPSTQPYLESPANTATAVRPSGERMPIFLTRLFEEKIFPESAIARPISRIFRRQGRVVRVAQTVALILLIVLAWGTTARYGRMIRVERQALLPTLRNVAGDMSETPRLPKGTTPELGQTACDLTLNMLQLNMNVFSSMFIPISRVSHLNDRVKQAMVPAFQKEVLSAVKTQLDSRATELTAPVPPAATLAESPTAGFAGLEDVKTYSVDKTPEYRALLSFASNLARLQQNVNRYESVRKPGEGSAEDLQGLADYLGCPIPSGSDIKHNPYVQSVLHEASGEPFNPGRFAGKMSATLAQLDQNYFNAWFAKDPVWVALTNLQTQIENLNDQQVGTYDDLTRLDQTISLLRALLSSPSSSWLSKPHLDLSGPLFQAAVAPVRRSPFFPSQMELSIRATAESSFQNLKTRLATTDTELTGDLLQSEGSSLQLSPTTVTLQLDVENVLNLPFMAMKPTRTMRSDLDPGTRLMWNPDQLNEALSLYQTFDRFTTEGLRNSAPVLRTVFRHIALSRLEANMLDLIAQAQIYEPIAASGMESSLTGANAAEIKSFEDAEPHLSQILDVFRKLGILGPYASLQKLTTFQASRLLAGIDAELGAEQPYVVKDGNFLWWRGESTPALMAFDVQTPEELEGYLTFQRQQMESLSSQAAPLVSFLSARSSGLSASQSRTYYQWRQIVSGLKSYDGKIPGSPLADLQDFIRTDMDKINPDQYCQGVSFGRSDAPSNNFFIQKRDTLWRGIYERCKSLADMAAYRNYSEVAKLFDHTLAGKFPFADSSVEDPASEADPAAIQAFYQLFDQHASATHLALTLTSAFGSTRLPALSFLRQMEGLRPVFASLLSGGNEAGTLAVDFLPTFRVNESKEIGGNQIIGWTLSVGADQFRDHEPQRVGRWKLGDPIRLSLLWAKDSPVVPVSDKNQPDLLVEGRDATFEFSDGWSLFRMLMKHHSPVADFPRLIDPHPYTLAFTLGTMADFIPTLKKGLAVPSETKVFVQISIMPPGKKDSLVLPSFPTTAPLLMAAPVE
jgi:type VI secretion system protein ImpL